MRHPTDAKRTEVALQALKQKGVCPTLIGIWLLNTGKGRASSFGKETTSVERKGDQISIWLCSKVKGDPLHWKDCLEFFCGACD